MYDYNREAEYLRSEAARLECGPDGDLASVQAEAAEMRRKARECEAKEREA